MSGFITFEKRPPAPLHPCYVLTVGRIFLKVSRYHGGQCRFTMLLNPWIMCGSILGLIYWGVGISDPVNFTANARRVLLVK